MASLHPWLLSAWGVGIAALGFVLLRSGRLQASGFAQWLLIGGVIAATGPLSASGFVPSASWLVVVIVLLVAKILAMDVARSAHELRIRRLIQRLAVLEALLESRKGGGVGDSGSDSSP